MKIAMPVDDKTMEAAVCQSLGRAPYFLFYNTITKESEFLDHSAAVSQGGSGIRAAQVIADNGVKALLTPRCGKNAEKILKNGEVFIYKSIPGTAKDNINAFTSDKLPLLSEIHPGLHGDDGEEGGIE